MRIISGFLKGKAINFLKNSNTRPLKDSVKESIFNVLQHSNSINIKIDQANILDLYSGVGSFGLECISRGAKKVTFIEQDQEATKVLKNNLIRLSLVNKAKIINDKIENAFKNIYQEKFNILFLDPPFADKEFTKNLNLIKKNKIYEKKCIVVIHREKKTKDELDNIIKIVLTKQYGRSKIIFGVFD